MSAARLSPVSLAMTSMLAVLTLVASGVPLLDPGDGTTTTQLMPRGETAQILVNGIYRFNPSVLAAEGFVWDVINVFVAVPAILVVLAWAYRGSIRARLAIAGLSLYVAYVYLQYAMMFAFSALFVAYVAAFAVGFTNLFLTLATIDPEHVRARASSRFPRRFFAGFAITLAGALVALWAVRIAAILRAGVFPSELAGMTTLETQALDLGLVVPLAIATGVLLIRDHPWGYVLIALTLGFGAMMFITIPAWIAVPLIRTGALNVAEVIPFALLCAVGIGLVVVFLRNVDDGLVARRRARA